MYVNPTRAAQVDFVPYLKIGSRVVVSKGNPAKSPDAT
jgi:polar amino acid transport system substrate-binding protein